MMLKTILATLIVYRAAAIAFDETVRTLVRQRVRSSKLAQG